MAAPYDTRSSCSGLNAKKLQKKLAKIESNLTSKEGIEISKNPTKVLCVQNGGLGNDVSQDELLPLFETFGAVKGIVMLPRKQYCFISFADVTSSLQAVECHNGHLLRRGKDASQDVILYFFYVLKAPLSVMPSTEKLPGLHIVENFISDEMEQALLREVNFQEVTDNSDVGIMKHRQVKHYGYEFKYGINDVDINDPLPNGIPAVCYEFLERARKLGLVNHFPDQLTVNQYNPGQGIPPHVDTCPAFEDGIMSLSLGSSVVMDFRHPHGRHLSVLVPQRSLLVMTGDSRYVWSHGITPRKSDVVMTPGGDGLTLLNRGIRTSLTFRKVIENRNLPEEDIIKASHVSKTLPETEEEAVKLEQQHVHKVYNNIADHFSGTRYKPWPRVVDFLMEQPPLSLLADVGCGNGKCLGVNKELFEIGSDYSSNLASICHSRGFETCVADVTCLPFCSSSFDIVLCIAVIHHMATKARRLKAVSEVVRILRPGGKALIYVWAMEQDYAKTSSKYINPNKQRKQNEWSSVIDKDNNNRRKEQVSDKVEEKATVSCCECGASSENSTFNEGAGNLGRGIDLETECEKPDCRKSLSDAKASTKPVESSDNCDISEQSSETSASKLASVPHEGLAKCNMPDCSQLKFCQNPVDTNEINTIASRIGVRHKGEDDTHSQASNKDPTSTCDGTTVHSKKLHVHVNRTQFKEQDLLVPWQLKCKQSEQCAVGQSEQQDDKHQLFHRFYHVFRQGELEAVCKRIPSCAVQKSYYDQGNWCVVLEKL